MTTPELKKWLRENSSGVYRPAAEAADLIEDMEHQRDTAVMLAGELVAVIRVNAMRGTWAEATPEQVYEFLAPWIEKLRVTQGHSPYNETCPSTGETEKLLK
jgi:hypothetical protein